MSGDIVRPGEGSPFEQVFSYGDHPVRVIQISDEPWFVALDVCTVLDIRNSRDAVAGLDDDERADAIETSESTDDGPYVRYSGLTRRTQRFFENVAAPVAEAKLRSVKEEAAVYLRVNGSGTPQSDEDMARAARVAAEA